MLTTSRLALIRFLLELAGSLQPSRRGRQRRVLGDFGLHVRLPTTDPLANGRGGGGGRGAAHSVDAVATRKLKALQIGVLAHREHDDLIGGLYL